MKNITLFCFLMLCTFGVEAQSYSHRWTDRIGPWNITAACDYSAFSDTVYRRVFLNGGPYYNPTWVPVQEIMLVGSGVDTIRFENIGSNSNGWGIMVQILDQNYNILQTEMISLQGVHPLPPPNIVAQDLIYGTPPSISFRADVFAPYGSGRASYYRTKLYCKLWRTNSVGYQSTVSWTFPIGVVPFANFNLPFEFFGDYCFVWWCTDEDTSINSHFGEVDVWRSDTLCFSLGSTGVEGLEIVIRDEDQTLSVYPNPTTGSFIVKSSTSDGYILTNMLGQVVDMGKLVVGENRFSIPELASGIYIIRTDSGQAIRIQKE